ncbi:MAG: alpha-L-fucosidase [bacterium]|nr:alpha-L-fucosidase [bacterium]
MTDEKRRELDEKLVQVLPSARQFAHQQLEFYGFVHFTVNTFTDKEWGDGSEAESVFAPSALDAEQWVRVAKEGGMRGLILTCKHHDGFCLWPSAYSTHTVANSPYKDGRGDVVRELAEACQKEGLKFGVYLSPWDRNSALYGQGKAYDDYFVAQLTELLTQYGPVFCVWFDGACGEGPNGKQQVYDWDRYYETIRRLQPDACISVSGPDIRWCGNEAGDTRESEWSVVPAALFDQRKITENSQQADTAAFREKKIADSDRDLGSRAVMARADSRPIWYPAEVNTSIRPGWFYHREEDDKVKSLEELKSVYLRAVGGNATFLLNLPPDIRGRFCEKDEERLRELGAWIASTFDRKKNLALFSEWEVSAENVGKGELSEALFDDSCDTWYEPRKAENALEQAAEESMKMRLLLSWKEAQEVRYLVLKENIRDRSQRIERFRILAEMDGQRKEIAAGTTVGYQKIVDLPKGCRTQRLEVLVLDSRMAPTLSYVGVFGESEGVPCSEASR